MIRKIKWAHDSVLGNLELDFTKDDGTVYPTIVLAGENGTGKTRILATLAEFISRGTMLPFRFIEYTVKGKNFKIFYDDDNDGKKAFTKDRILAIIHQYVNTYKVMQPSIW